MKYTLELLQLEETSAPKVFHFKNEKQRDEVFLALQEKFEHHKETDEDGFLQVTTNAYTTFRKLLPSNERTYRFFAEGDYEAIYHFLDEQSI